METSDLDYQELITYPKDSDNVIRVEDYKCLDKDEQLNNVILDFYLQLLYREKFSEEMRQRVHIFSTSFYSLYSKSSDYRGWKEENLPAHEKRYKQVQGLPELDVNIFEKDFIVIPCIDASPGKEHWFLAIVCYPKLNGSVTYEENIPVDDEETHYNLKDPSLGRPVKIPCILIFDSAKGAARKTTAQKHIAKFLDTEFQKKYKGAFTFSHEALKKITVAVPMQNNDKDCGLYLLQFFEHFFLKAPIKDFRQPISRPDWFDSKIIYSKREKIAELIKILIIDEKGLLPELPELKFHRRHKKSQAEVATEGEEIKNSNDVQHNGTSTSTCEDVLNNNIKEDENMCCDNEQPISAVAIKTNASCSQGTNKGIPAVESSMEIEP